MTTLTSRSTKGAALTHNEMDANLKRDTQTKAANYTVVEADNRSVIEVTATATITLPDAATIAAAADTGDFEATLKNVAANALTITCITVADTIAGSTDDFVLTAIDSVTLKVNQAGDGYNIISGGATKSGTETWENKTLTSPEIVTPTIDGDITEATTNADLNFVSNGTGDVTYDGSVIQRIDARVAAATTSGTSKVYGAIPAWAKKVTVSLNQVSTDGTDEINIRLGHSGGLETTAYLSIVSVLSTGTSTANSSTSSIYFLLQHAGVANDRLTGSVVFTLQDSTTDFWAMSGTLYQAGVTDTQQIVSGGINLSGVLTQLQFRVSGTDSFDNGSFNILIEG